MSTWSIGVWGCSCSRDHASSTLVAEVVSALYNTGALGRTVWENNTQIILSIHIGRSGQTVLTQIRLLLKGQSNQGLQFSILSAYFGHITVIPYNGIFSRRQIFAVLSKNIGIIFRVF